MGRIVAKSSVVPSSLGVHPSACDVCVVCGVSCVVCVCGVGGRWEVCGGCGVSCVVWVVCGWGGGKDGRKKEREASTMMGWVLRPICCDV